MNAIHASIGDGALEPSATHRRRRVDTRRQANLRRWWRARIAAGPITCPWCGYGIGPEQAWHLDHLIPVSAGGTDDPANQHPMHAACNLAKAAQTLQARPVVPAPPSRNW